MAELTLDEEFFLLTRDEKSGRDQTWTGVDTPLAGAVLIELAAVGAITIDDQEHVLVKTGRQLRREHHRLALETIKADDKPRKPSHWLSRLPSKVGLQERIGVSLAELGVLRDDRSTFLGITQKKFPELDPGPERRLRAALAQALTGPERSADPKLMLLGGLLSSVDRIKTIVDKPYRKDADKRAKEWAKSSPVNTAVGKSVEAMQMAVMTAVFVPIFVSSSNS